MEIVKFNEFADSRGALVAVEENAEIPFQIKRIYYIYRTLPNISRGFHAHANLKQMVICVSGSCRFVVEDSSKREEFILSDPAEGLYIEGVKWREIHDLSEDCVLLVLASEKYNPEDYIRDYDSFRKLISGDSHESKE